MIDGPERTGSAGARDARRAATKARLLEAARRRFSEQGYDNTSVTESARDAGVTHAMINAYFEGKAGLLYALVTELNSAQIAKSAQAEARPGDTLARLTCQIQIWMEYDLRDPRLLAVLLAFSWQWSQETEARNRAELDAALEPARRILRRGIAEGELRPDLDVDRFVEVFYASYLWSVRPAVLSGAPLAECLREAEGCIELLLRGARRHRD